MATHERGLDLAARNFATFWERLAAARGHGFERRPGFAASFGAGRGHLRVLTLAPDPAPDAVAELRGLVRDRLAGDRQVVVEDPYARLDLTDLGLRARQLPVLVRAPAPVPAAALPLRRVDRVDDLAVAERLIVRDFDLPAYQPYRAGEVLPPSMVDDPAVAVCTVHRDAAVVGTGIAVVSAGVGGVYYVTTATPARSSGVGRAFMHGLLNGHLAGLPVVLTASRAGRPLYESLGFTSVGVASWWVPGEP